MKKIFLNISLCVICFFALLYGIWNVKHVYGESNPDAALVANESIKVQYAESADGFLNINVADLLILEQNSDIIVKAKVLEDRTMSARSTKTKLCIKEVLSSVNANLSEGDDIYLIEPVTLLRGEVYDTNGYQMAHTGEEYIFLLKNLECVDGYCYTKEQEITYMPTSVYYSKYAVSYMEIPKILNSRAVLYNDIKDYAILTEDNNTLSTYETLMKQVKKKYNK